MIHNTQIHLIAKTKRRDAFDGQIGLFLTPENNRRIALTAVTASLATRLIFSVGKYIFLI
jgi:hypothetical protein